jgi:hypothetical protein
LVRQGDLLVDEAFRRFTSLPSMVATCGPVMAHRVALRATRRLRAALSAAGFMVAAFPELCPRVDAAGCPQVVVGAVSVRVTVRLGELLSRAPDPHHGRAA